MGRIQGLNFDLQVLGLGRILLRMSLSSFVRLQHIVLDVNDLYDQMLGPRMYFIHLVLTLHLPLPS